MGKAKDFGKGLAEGATTFVAFLTDPVGIAADIGYRLIDRYRNVKEYEIALRKAYVKSSAAPPLPKALDEYKPNTIGAYADRKVYAATMKDKEVPTSKKVGFAAGYFLGTCAVFASIPLIGRFWPYVWAASLAEDGVYNVGKRIARTRTGGKFVDKFKSGATKIKNRFPTLKRDKGLEEVISQ